MPPIRCLIIEDAYYTSQELRLMVEKLRPNFSIVKIAEGVGEAIEFLKRDDTDLIIADANVSDGDTVEMLRSNEINIPLILLASYDKDNTKLRGMNLIDYIYLPPEKYAVENALLKFEKSRI